MHKLLSALVAIILWALALVAAQPSFGAFTALSAMADTSGAQLVCVTPTLNPHPTSPVGQSSDALFCSPAPTASQSGSGNNATGSGGSSSGSSSSRGTTTTAGSRGQTQLAGGPSNGSTLTTANGNEATGDQSAVNGSRAGGKPSSSNSGPFGGLLAFLSAAGGLGLLFAFLILLAIILLIIGVAGWLRRREAGATWGSRFARVTHRA